MDYLDNYIECPKCKGLGSSGNIFIDGKETPEVSKTCDRCNGTGQVSRFFIEFTFKYNPRTYWLPLFILAADIDSANKIVKVTKIVLEEQYKDVKHTKPLIKNNITTKLIDLKFRLNERCKIATLDVYVWKFSEHINANPDLSFNKNLEFIPYYEPNFHNSSIAKVTEAYKFPVRVIQEDFKLDYKDYLLLDVLDSK